MRILDDELDKKLDLVSIFLTEIEIRHLIGYLKQLLDKKIDHAHLISEDYQKEITVCMYDGSGVKKFSARVEKLIREDT